MKDYMDIKIAEKVAEMREVHTLELEERDKEVASLTASLEKVSNHLDRVQEKSEDASFKTEMTFNATVRAWASMTNNELKKKLGFTADAVALIEIVIVRLLAMMDMDDAQPGLQAIVTECLLMVRRGQLYIAAGLVGCSELAGLMGFKAADLYFGEMEPCIHAQVGDKWESRSLLIVHPEARKNALAAVDKLIRDRKPHSFQTETRAAGGGAGRGQAPKFSGRGGYSNTAVANTSQAANPGVGYNNNKRHNNGGGRGSNF